MFNWQVSLDDCLVTISQTFLVYDDLDLTVLRNISWAFCRTSLHVGLSDVFLMGFGVCGEEDFRLKGILITSH